MTSHSEGADLRSRVLLATAAATTAAAMAGITPHTSMPVRAPKWLVTAPMTGAPTGVPPMKTSMYRPMTRPRSSGSTESCTDALAIAWQTRLTKPMPTSSTIKTPRSGASAAATCRMPNTAAQPTIARVLGRVPAPANTAPAAEPRPSTMLNSP